MFSIARNSIKKKSTDFISIKWFQVITLAKKKEEIEEGMDVQKIKLKKKTFTFRLF
jgi:hypothetical protein